MNSIAPEQKKFWRNPDTVMKLARMGSSHQCRLSFMRTLLRRFKKQQWQFKRSFWEIDQKGVGLGLYTATGPQRSYTLIAYAHDLPDEQRSDRVIATAWDATFTLFDGIPNETDIERLRANVPYQEAGRISQSELTLARANRSGRLFSYVVDSLSKGQQPEKHILEEVAI